MLSNVIGRFQTGTYVVTRTATGTTVNGRYTPGAASTFNVDAVVQPLDPRTVTPLPEGVRSEDVRLVHLYGTTPMRTSDGGLEADYVTIGGEKFYAWKVEGPWQLRGSTHYEAHVAKRGRT